MESIPSFYNFRDRHLLKAESKLDSRSLNVTDITKHSPAISSAMTALVPVTAGTQAHLCSVYLIVQSAIDRGEAGTCAQEVPEADGFVSWKQGELPFVCS